MMEDREVWRLISSCCSRNTHGKAGNEERRRTQLFKSVAVPHEKSMFLVALGVLRLAPPI